MTFRTTKLIQAVCTAALAAATLGTSAADTVELTNGDVLTGKVVAQTDTGVTLDHAILGQIVIERSRVSTITPEGAKPDADAEAGRFVCHLDERGRPALGPRCVVLLSLLGLVTGVLSGMFGVGGGFLITPLLFFIGVPPSVAVATSASQIVAHSSMKRALFSRSASRRTPLAFTWKK